MTNIEERLKHVKKLPVSEGQVQTAKAKILQKSIFKKTNFGPFFVTAAMFVILCILIFIPVSKQTEHSAATVIQKDIEDIVYVTNKRTSFNLDPNSFNYLIARHTITDKQDIVRVQDILKETIQNPKPWTRKIKGYDTYETAINFTDGTTQLLKIELYAEDGMFVYDVKNKLQYEIKNLDYNSEVYYIFANAKNFKGLLPVFIFILVATVIVGIISNFYQNKYRLLDERGKPKRLAGWKSLLPYFVFIVPLFMMTNIFGTFHIGLSLILSITYTIINSQLEFRYGVVRKNNMYYKFILPTYIFMFIVAILITLIV